uniref:Cytokine receptor-like factor 2-like D1 domain-containing protein n=1 Tax=Salarias fasciatus TaxID=181472 RepID=A0A672GVI5_SALFA
NGSADVESTVFLNATMTTRLLLFLCLFGSALDVSCVVVDLRHVSCIWNQQGTPEVNYTFISCFHYEDTRVCTSYLSENNVNTGCIRPYAETQRFRTFYTNLVHGNNSFTTKHDLKHEVLLNPPTNVTALYGEDRNLCFYWNHTQNCVRSEFSVLREGAQRYCIYLASSTDQYELQVHSKLDDACGASRNWSNWSEPVEWGSNSGPGKSERCKTCTYKFLETLESSKGLVPWVPVLPHRRPNRLLSLHSCERTVGTVQASLLQVPSEASGIC